MDQYKTTIDFFNSHAENWDSRQKEFDFERVNEIIERIAIPPHSTVLDVGCGTGIFTEQLLAKGITNVTGLDIAPQMIDLYRSKFPHQTAITHSFEEYNFKEQLFDFIVIFNAFPHFKNSESIFKKAKQLLSPKGKLIIAHSMNRHALNEHHRNAGREVKDDILISDNHFHSLYENERFSDIEVNNGDYFFSIATKN